MKDQYNDASASNAELCMEMLANMKTCMADGIFWPYTGGTDEFTGMMHDENPPQLPGAMKACFCQCELRMEGLDQA